MKTLHNLTYILLGSALSLALTLGSGHKATAAATTEITYSLLKNGDETPEKSAAKANKPKKIKKGKRRPTTHGPRKPIYPSVHRIPDPLDHKTHKDQYNKGRKA